MDDVQKKKEMIKYFLDKGVLVGADLLEQLSHMEDYGQMMDTISQKTGATNLMVLGNDVSEMHEDPNWQEIERARARVEKETGFEMEKKIDYDLECPVKIVYSYQEEPKKKDVQDFVGHFNSRYKVLKSVLMNRQELQGATSISKLFLKKEKESVAIIGLVLDKQTTKNNSIVLTLEDPTGTVKVIVNKSKPEMVNVAKDIVYDEVIGIAGMTADKAIFANTILFPDVPLTKELKKASEEVYAVTLSCVHVGSKLFLPDEFQRFIDWMGGKVGSPDQKRIASLVKYVFITGDLVDGIGTYPRQEDELTMPDIYEQYKELARYLRQIPPDKRIILCPGNHDVVRIAEPQPPIYKEYSKELWELPNVVMVSNPAMVNIHAKNGHPGFDVLMYHGYSYIYYGDKVEGIRTAGKSVSERVELIMRFLLQRRHLAPSHTSTQYIPDPDRDPLLIEKVPDLFLSGHIHKSSVSTYRGVTLVSGSCFQEKTDYMEKFGVEPDPGKVPLINLQTREVKLLKFGK